MLRMKTVVLALGLLALATPPTFGASGPPPFVSGQPTPVIVENPATSPAITSSVDDPGRTAYQSTLTPDCHHNPNCTATFSAVPAGHRLVIQHVSGNAIFAATPGDIVFVTVGPTDSAVGQIPIIAFYGPFIGNSSIFDQQILIYFDAGAKPSVAMHTGVKFNDMTVSLMGYLLECTVNQCAPIAQ
jgi:hypothetical protein